MEGETGWDTQSLDYTYHDFELIVCSVLIFDLLDELWEDLPLKYLLKYLHRDWSSLQNPNPHFEISDETLSNKKNQML